MNVSAVGVPTYTVPASVQNALASKPAMPAVPADVFTASATPPPKNHEAATLPARALYTVGCGVVGTYAGIVAFGGPLGALGGAFGAYYGYKNADDISVKNAAIVAGLTIGGAIAGGAVAGQMGQAAGAVLGFIAGEAIHKHH